MRLARKLVLPLRLLVVGAVAASGLVAASAAPASAATGYKKAATKKIVTSATRYASVKTAIQYDTTRNRYRAVLWLDCWYKGKRSNCSVGTIGVNLYGHSVNGASRPDERLKYKYTYVPKGVGKDGHIRVNTPWWSGSTHNWCLMHEDYISDLKLKNKHYFASESKYIGSPLWCF